MEKREYPFPPAYIDVENAENKEYRMGDTGCGCCSESGNYVNKKNMELFIQHLKNQIKLAEQYLSEQKHEKNT